jgi:hypothetical protein
MNAAQMRIKIQSAPEQKKFVTNWCGAVRSRALLVRNFAKNHVSKNRLRMFYASGNSQA